MNRIKFLAKIAYTASFSFALAFTISCSSDNDNGDDSFNENSPISNYTGNGVIKIELDEESLINAGSVTNGVVKLELPNIEDKYLIEFSDELEWDEEEIADYCTNYSKDIKIAGGGFVLTSSEGKYIGDLEIYYGDKQIEESIIYLYFSKAGKITCNFENEEIYDIDAKAGWNRMYYHKSYNSSSREFSTKNILTKEKNLKWGLYQDQ